jgi:pimeloyl-ACP methyl ester carboxylesterase
MFERRPRRVRTETSFYQTLVTRESAAKLLQMLLHARYVDVADASHMVAGDRNDVFSAVVLEFALPPLLANDG